MPKRDPIFWGATAIFLVSFVTAFATQNDLWLFLMAATYLLRPTLASLGLARRLVDERQMSIQYRSGNIAFAVMLGAAIYFAISLRIKNDHSWEMFNAVIILGLASKALFNVLLQKNYRESGSQLIMAVGLLVTLFVAAENGATFAGLMESLPWLGIVVIGWLARKFPRTIGSLIFVIDAALLFFILGKGLTWGQFTTALVVCIPLLLAGWSLFAREKSDSEPVSDLPA